MKNQTPTRTLVLYRKGSYECFIAAFVHWAIYGTPDVQYRAVDVFDDVRDHGVIGRHVVTFGLCKREADFSVEGWVPGKNSVMRRGAGECITDKGIAAEHAFASRSLSALCVDNSPGFAPDAYTVHATHCYESGKPLYQLFAEHLQAYHALDSRDCDTLKLIFDSLGLANRHSRFYQLMMHLVSTKYCPDLDAECFETLGTLLKDGPEYLNGRRKKISSIADAVTRVKSFFSEMISAKRSELVWDDELRNNEVGAQLVKKSNVVLKEAPIRQLTTPTGSVQPTLVINTDLHSNQIAIAHMRAARSESILLYQQHGEYVRATYLPANDADIINVGAGAAVQHTDRVDIKVPAGEFLTALNQAPLAA
jgi:hypothetical protein